MPPLKAGMQAGERDHDQPRSARPLHRASLPHHPDLLLSRTDPGHGYPSGLGGTWVSRRSHARQWLHVVAQHQQNPSPAAPGLSQAAKGSGQIPKGGSEPGCRRLGWQGRHGQRGDSLLRPRDFSASQGFLCNFEFKGERGFFGKRRPPNACQSPRGFKSIQHVHRAYGKTPSSRAPRTQGQYIAP